MIYKGIIESISSELDKVLEYAKQKLGTVRTGRANPALVENILVDVYGSKMPINQIAAISAPDPRKLRIDPWDKSYIELISSAIQKESSLSAASDSSGVWVSMPDLTADIRKDMIKVVAQIDDSSKKTIRKWRDEAWTKIQKAEKNGEISEDAKFKGKDELQKVIDNYNKKIDELVSSKKNELQG